MLGCCFPPDCTWLQTLIGSSRSVFCSLLTYCFSFVPWDKGPFLAEHFDWFLHPVVLTHFSASVKTDSPLLLSSFAILASPGSFSKPRVLPATTRFHATHLLFCSDHFSEPWAQGGGMEASNQCPPPPLCPRGVCAPMSTSSITVPIPITNIIYTPMLILVPAPRPSHHSELLRPDTARGGRHKAGPGHALRQKAGPGTPRRGG